jgi:hypothetical protein
VLEQARRDREGSWPGLASGPRQEWRQLRRQAALLADLLAEPLEDVLRHAAGSKDDEWRAEFEARYRGRAVVLDVSVQRLGDGAYRHNYCLLMPHDTARLDLGDLALLRRLPLDQPRRLVLGARLASVSREPPGGWVVRFAPSSGVLLTDPGAATACCVALGDAATAALLEEQAAWVTGGAAEKLVPDEN